MNDLPAIVLAAAAGIALGPLIDQVAHRAARHERFDPPTCRACGRGKPVVRWWGRCPACQAPVGRRVWAAAMLGGVAAGGAVVVTGVTPLLPAYLLFALATAVLVLTDVEAKLIPNRVLYPATGAFALLLAGGALADGTASGLGRAALGAAGYFAVLLVVALLARGGFGLGDVKLAVLLGMATAFPGWRVLAAAAMFTALLGGIPAIVLLATGRARRDTELPYGPAMIFGAWIALAVGQATLDWYLG